MVHDKVLHTSQLLSIRLLIVILCGEQRNGEMLLKATQTVALKHFRLGRCGLVDKINTFSFIKIKLKCKV